MFLFEVVANSDWLIISLVFLYYFNSFSFVLSL